MGLFDWLKKRNERKKKEKASKGHSQDMVTSTSTKQKEDIVPDKSFEKYVEQTIENAKKSGRVFASDEEAKKWALTKIQKKVDRIKFKQGNPMECNICHRVGAGFKSGGLVKQQDGGYAHQWCIDKKPDHGPVKSWFAGTEQVKKNDKKEPIPQDRICPQCGGHRWRWKDKNAGIVSCRGFLLPQGGPRCTYTKTIPKPVVDLQPGVPNVPVNTEPVTGPVKDLKTGVPNVLINTEPVPEPVKDLQPGVPSVPENNEMSMPTAHNE